MLIEIDNTNCTVDINSITISVTNNVTLRSRGHSTSDHYTVYSKRINGLSAGMSKTVSLILHREQTPSDRLSLCQSKNNWSQLAQESYCPVNILSISKWTTIFAASAALISSVLRSTWYVFLHIDHLPNDSKLSYGSNVRTPKLATPGHAHEHHDSEQRLQQLQHKRNGRRRRLPSNVIYPHQW